MGVRVDREQAVAYRIAAQQLDRAAERSPSELAVIDLGMQDTPYGSARLALAARTSALDDEAVVLAWAARGAPHLHRSSDLPALAAALWPLSDADATARISSSAIKEGAKSGIAAFVAAATAMREVVTRPMPKGEVSAAVSALIPKELTFWCKVCEAQHISGLLFQQAGLFAGVRLELDGPRTVLVPTAGERPPIPEEPGQAAEVVRTYLRLLGPATPAEVAAFVGTRQSELKRAWPQDLVELTLDGKPRWITADRLAVLESPPTPRLTRLLPPSDPYLQARDRELIVPDEAKRKEVWRTLGNPGALLVDGEIAGIWRPRKKGNSVLEITVTPFAPLPPTTRTAIETEATHLTTARNLKTPHVHYEA